MARLWFLPALFLLALAAAPTRADQSVRFGDYVAHYNAFNSDMLDPRVAAGYGIQRSQNRAVLMVSVQRAGTVPGGIRAKVNATARDPATQAPQEVTIREVKEGDAWYYLADFPVGNGQVLEFHVSVQPEGTTATHAFDYRQQFFTKPQ
jgi:hypothetical protein